LDASVKQALDGMRVELNVAPVSDGKVVLSGVLPGALSADQLREALHRDVPGLASIVLNVVSTSEATHWLHDQMAANGIDASEVSITHDDTSLIATGELAASVRGPWHDLAAEFVKRYGEQLTLQDKVTFTAAPENPVVQFNLVVRAVSIGPPAYITLDTGEKYLVGSRLSNGMVLEKIMPDGMVLRDGETRHLVEIAPDSGRVTRAGKVESK
jgi:type III secretion system YscD/HrpQ family protein